MNLISLILWYYLDFDIINISWYDYLEFDIIDITYYLEFRKRNGTYTVVE